MLGIGNFDKINTRKVITREGQRLYMGKKYAQDKKTGYYVCTSGERTRLHVAIWEHEHGMRVPEGHVIHHKDWNKTNNSVDNLVCITIREHELIHTPPKKGTETEEDLRLIKKLKEMGLIIE